MSIQIFSTEAQRISQISFPIPSAMLRFSTFPYRSLFPYSFLFLYTNPRPGGERRKRYRSLKLLTIAGLLVPAAPKGWPPPSLGGGSCPRCRPLTGVGHPLNRLRTQTVFVHNKFKNYYCSILLYIITNVNFNIIVNKLKKIQRERQSKREFHVEH